MTIPKHLTEAVEKALPCKYDCLERKLTSRRNPEHTGDCPAHYRPDVLQIVEQAFEEGVKSGLKAERIKIVRERKP